MSSQVQINYEGNPVAEAALDGTDYRVDAGKQGTALCVSQRASGTWDWAFVCEARWDGSDLRSKALERSVLQQLSSALRAALQEG